MWESRCRRPGTAWFTSSRSGGNFRGRSSFEWCSNEVAKLRDRFPDSATPGEACELAGINPKKFEIEEELSS
jgi:hypothetical protein